MRYIGQKGEIQVDLYSNIKEMPKELEVVFNNGDLFNSSKRIQRLKQWVC